MPDSVHHALEVVVKLLEIAGAGALVLGFVMASVHFVARLKTAGIPEARERYRRALGRVVLVGLEVLIAATIIKTITVAPTPEGLGLLALMIAIRTILSWTMTLEMDGRWPWQQKAPAEQPES